MLNVLLARLGRSNTPQAIRAAVFAASTIADATETAPCTIVNRSAVAAAAAEASRELGLFNVQMLTTASAAGSDQLFRS
jgi:hypothetical protein